jgi:molecular chaperone DnaK (HSP70)
MLSLPLSPAPRGVPQIDITLYCDLHGIADITALERHTGKKVTVSLGNTGRLSAEEIDRMRAEAEKYKVDEKAEAERISARNALESYAYTPLL